MNNIYVKIDGITCTNCEDTIRKKLLQNKNIKEISFNKNICLIKYKGKINLNKIIDDICGLDYFTCEDYIKENINDLNNIRIHEFILISILILITFLIIYKVFGYNIFNVIPVIDSNISYGMLFFIGIFTSIHCISMCGAINIIATKSKKGIKNIILYNFGRVLSYTILGGIAGLIGSVFKFNEILSGIIILLAAIIMLIMSLSMLGICNLKNIKLLKNKIHSRNSFVIGLLNGLMPCGPLQAMQLYALSTSNFIYGALSMLLFGLGTVPLMFFSSFIFNNLKGKKKILLNKTSAVLIFILSLGMIFRGISTLGFNITNLFKNYGNYEKSIIYNKYQEVNIDLSYDGYEDIIVQKGIKVRLVINVSKKYLTGCNNEVVISEYGIRKKLVEGKNIIEFMPKKEGVFTMNCWMNMLNNSIKVVDDYNYFEVRK